MRKIVKTNMNINDVSKSTGLTKKAINYYISKNLINPSRNLENNYRIFKDIDIKRLNVISALRQLNISVNAINELFEKRITYHDLLEKRIKEIDSNLVELKEEKNLIKKYLSQNYIDEENNINFEHLEHLKDSVKFIQMKRSNYINEQWQNIFPGSLGKLLSMIYENFLNEPLITDEKKEAWKLLVFEIDNLDEIEIPEEIKNIIESDYFSDFINNFEKNTQKSNNDMTNEIIESFNNINDLEILSFQKEKIKDLLKIQKFIRENLSNKLLHLDKYLEILSSKYKECKQNMEKTVNVIKKDYPNIYKSFNELKKDLN